MNDNNLDVEALIRKTDALTFLNALKAAISELKEEITTIEETKEYQNQACERARKLIRRIDNQYRAVTKAATGVEAQKEIDNQNNVVVEWFGEEEEHGT